jgi:hypothetical protein
MAADIPTLHLENAALDSCRLVPAKACRDQSLMKLAAFELNRIVKLKALYRQHDAVFTDSARGLPVIEHSDLTQVRIYELAEQFAKQGTLGSHC